MLLIGVVRRLVSEDQHQGAAVASLDDRLKKEAVTLLEGLRQRFPLALEIGLQLVLALMDAGQRDRATAELQQLRSLVRNPNESSFSS